MDRDNLLELMSASSVFLHPTSYDVWGLVINEATAMGLPIVTTESCISSKSLILSGYNGFVIPSGSYEDMIKHVLDIIYNDEKQRKFAHNSLLMAQNFTIEKMVDTHISFINRQSKGQYAKKNI